MEKTDAFAAGTVILAILINAAAAYAYISGGLELLWTAFIVAIVIIIAVFLVLYFVFGAYYFVKQKDTTHTDSGMSLGDVTEVDREMEKK